jgi:thioredoxin 1
MARKNVVEVNDLNFATTVLASDEPVLLDFTATWCGPCRMLAPIVERIADEHVGTLRVGAIDIDESPGVATKLGIRGAPTVVAFRGGVETGRQVGTTNKETLLRLVGLGR